jgi:23S rRNA (guanosine2251-2'-O)-methyltransferase
VKALERVHGLHAVRALLARQPTRIRRLVVADARRDARAEELLALARTAGCAIQLLPARDLEKLAGAAAVHQGVVAEVEPLAPWSEEQLLGALANQPRPLLLALDGVQDPHNLGACLRTADACGALAVVVPRDRAAQLTDTVRKVAAGAAETTPVAVVTNLARCLRLLQGAGLWVVGAAAEAEIDAAAADLTVPTVLVLGAEGTGLRRLTRDHCDVMVRLPSLGAVESLNVSVAAGMLLYEACRQRALPGAASRPA